MSIANNINFYMHKIKIKPNLKKIVYLCLLEVASNKQGLDFFLLKYFFYDTIMK